MLTKEEALIQPENTNTTASNKKKKTVSWNDNQNEGKISEQHLKIGQSATPTKKTLDTQMTQLVEKEGYSELEAAAFTGKPKTLSGQVIISHPLFYDSQADIQKKVAEKKELKSVNDNQEKSTPNSSSRSTMIRIGIPAIEVSGENSKSTNGSQEKSASNNSSRTTMFRIGIPAIEASSGNNTNVNHPENEKAKQVNKNTFFTVRRPLIIGMSPTDACAIMALTKFNY